ncbi:sugar phosphate isomerase/epimerase family protein [Paenibacillus thalictri]|uniref:sugar phosphate isomerase/epimerase family protein n=1 Tax=Paenibacillus thalictri TaxID=2527873 RepID=UPI0013EF2A95|nr:sugar phosphate isomerase/epimerase family protein [Paenibacillus thalictri]
MKDNLALLLEHNYDFAELTVGTLMGVPEDDFPNWVHMIQASGIDVPVLNSFIPRTIKLTGPDVNKDAIENYLKIAFARVKAIGATTIVFGSGGARSFPEGFSKSEAVRQVSAFLQMCSHYAAQYSIHVVIEPLNRKESNVINTVAEALELAKELRLPYISVLADSYHMLEEQENLSVLSDAVASGLLTHVHIADRGRVFPGLPAPDGMDFRAFFQELHKSGYEGRISAECRSDDFSVNSKRSLDYVRTLWASLS